MGLRPLDLATWLDADPDDPQMGLRRDLLERRRSEVFGAIADTEAACRLVANAVAGHVGGRLPGQDHPLVEAARLVRDDLCVLQQVADQWRLTAAVVCFPSRWRLADKMGKDVLAIHDPVPRYRTELGEPTRRVLGSAAGRSPRWRVNWTLLDDPALFQPAPPVSTRHQPGPGSYLRVERQCLVPVDKVLVFSIRTTVIQVSQLPAARARAVLESARTTPHDFAVYRGWTGE